MAHKEVIEPRIVLFPEKKGVGCRMTMSSSNLRMKELWGRFMPRRKEVLYVGSPNLISLAVYGPTYFEKFDATHEFERWALVEVENIDQVPDGMEPFLIPRGSYAVFTFKGSSKEVTDFFQFIYTTWLPSSGYVLDQRPHFEILGARYKNEDPESEEEIWIPVIQK